MFPQHINRLENSYDDNASLLGDKPDNEDELNDNEEVLFFKIVITCNHLNNT